MGIDKKRVRMVPSIALYKPTKLKSSMVEMTSTDAFTPKK